MPRISTATKHGISMARWAPTIVMDRISSQAAVFSVGKVWCRALVSGDMDLVGQRLVHSENPG